MNKIFQTLKKSNAIFCQTLICKTNLKRDIFVVAIAIIVSLGFLGFGEYQEFRIEKQKKVQIEKFVQIPEALAEKESYQEIKNVQETTNIDNWKSYQSRWYGFELKYPETWAIPVGQVTDQNSKWEYRYQFRKKDFSESSPFRGFDLVVYNLSKIKELSNTEEFPSIKNENLKAEGKCSNIQGHIIETGDYPAEEIYVGPNDDCYNSTLFFTLIKGNYIYNLVPVFKEGSMTSGDLNVEMIDNFPEFFSVASTLSMIDIVRPKPIPPKPKITAPLPVSFKIVDGKRVCAKKNDKPKKSKKTKKKHLDMECCLDPDEYPNPHCHYAAKKYQKYL